MKYVVVRIEDNCERDIAEFETLIDAKGLALRYSTCDYRHFEYWVLEKCATYDIDRNAIIHAKCKNGVFIS